MKVLSILLCATLIIPLMGSCRTHYVPPQRPTAGMYPTLLPASELRRFTPVEITTAELEEHLKELSFWAPLMKSQLQETELALVARSIARRGYAELDSRRCDCTVHWVIFMGYPAGELTIVGEVEDQQIIRQSWPISPVQETITP